jgi:hypothetical protein
VRRGRDKLVVLGEEWQLFDLDSDLSESVDITASKPAVVGQMRELFDDWNQGNRPAIFPSYREYHRLLKAFHQRVKDDAQAADQTEIK